MKLPKFSPAWAMFIALAGYITIDTAGLNKFPDNQGQTTVEQIDTSSIPVDSLGFIEMTEDPGNGDSGIWFIVNAVVTNEKKTDDPGRPSNTYQDNYILIDQFVFIHFENPIPILEAINKQIRPPAGGSFTKVYRIRMWNG